MKHKITAILSLFISLTLLTSCGSTKKSVVLCISHSSWSGMSVEENKEESESYTATKGDSIELGGMNDLVIKIVSVTNDKIVFKTNVPMSDHEDGTIDLETDKTRFELSTGKQLTLMTPTMDAGDSYRFEIQSIE